MWLESDSALRKALSREKKKLFRKEIRAWLQNGILIKIVLR